ncbi:inositol monophosphatase family protein [Desulfosoma caldarium]|uniref:Inositol-1-monophosphatase n=1 Tax=Desulfosoma caldarium TaxID=610254 RepID=A0A3N1UMX8_9BACT|nr:inositol monophosphatase family protein [Desulfosoma caldarium]ROQ91098.1 myo-inositol-1(or 4)-monophosphatase [Desulfosoma caldarium]
MAIITAQEINADAFKEAMVKNSQQTPSLTSLLPPREAHLARTTARLAIFEAGAYIREKFQSQAALLVESKGSFDYVTEVDRWCEELILHRLRSAFPDHTLMSEERPVENHSPSHVWIVDPLDGTTNFIHGFPMIAISIAFSIQGTVVMGWVYDPLRRELFEAHKGAGAWCNDRPLPPMAPTPLQEALVATGFPFRAKDLLDPYLEVFKAVFSKVSGIRRAGSAALDLAYVAAGRVQGFWETGLKPWDVAAAALLIQETAGVVTDFWGSPAYLENGHIVAGSSMVHRFLMDSVAPLREALSPPSNTAPKRRVP